MQTISADLAGASILAGRLEGMTIEGVPVMDTLAYWRSGQAEGKS